MSKKKNKVENFSIPRTPEQEKFAQKIEQARRKVRKAKEERDELLEKCVHSVAYSVDNRWSTPEGHAWCDLCEKGFGHYCPESPDHACHYFTEDGLMVKLVTGELVQKPQREISPEWDIVTVNNDSRRDENYDDCLFCGAPDERK